MNFPIFLLGFMASGKSSKGKILAKKLDVAFVDLDREIEVEENKSIASIFEEEGEEYFRKTEARVLRNIPQNLKAIVALGGGTPCFHDNMNYLNSFGTSVYLKQSEPRILGRLRASKEKRPLVANLPDEELKRFITKSLVHRDPYYRKASIILESDEDQVSSILERLKA